MSHETGKVEVVGMTETQIFFKYIRAVEAENFQKFLVFNRNPEAYWFDDYEEAKEELALRNLFHPSLATNG